VIADYMCIIMPRRLIRLIWVDRMLNRQLLSDVRTIGPN